MARVEPYGINLILTGDIREIAPKMETGSVHCIICSPPYFGLRDYGVEGQIGLEETPQEYIETLVGIFRELRRVLRDDGTVWLNLGDSYAGNNTSNGEGETRNLKTEKFHGGKAHLEQRRVTGNCNLPSKNLLGIPWRVALALQSDGWYLRSDIIWAKKNPMPESVRDRPTKAHEYIFLLSKKPRYYYDQEAVREPSSEDYAMNGRKRNPDKTLGPGFEIRGNLHNQNGNATRNRRTVWAVASKPYPQAHFATFPPDLIRPCILAGCPERVCAECGAPWVRVVEKEETPSLNTSSTKYKSSPVPGDRRPMRPYLPRHLRTDPSKSGMGTPATKTVGFEPTCTCNAPTTPGIVFDPFIGSGTVAQVAIEEGRNWIGVELNPDYVKLAVERILNAKPKPPYEQTEIAYG